MITRTKANSVLETWPSGTSGVGRYIGYCALSLHRTCLYPCIIACICKCFNRISILYAACMSFLWWFHDTSWTESEVVDILEIFAFVTLLSYTQCIEFVMILFMTIKGNWINSFDDKDLMTWGWVFNICSLFYFTIVNWCWICDVSLLHCGNTYHCYG